MDGLKNFKNIDINSFKKYFTAQAVKDFDAFLDALPLNVGYNALAAVGIAWIIAGGAVVFTSMEVEKVSKIRAELMKVEALKPPVPVIEYLPINQGLISDTIKKIIETYKGVNVIAGSGGSVTVSAADTDYFPQFLAAISFLQSGGKNWRVRIDSMCVGKDCPTSKLSATLKVEVAHVGEPAKKDQSDEKGSKPNKTESKATTANANKKK